ncbi:TcpE family conjugal transfer membrane protein [Nocardiopsis sp. NPDC007018]|uniref:TcpE family conjugal transfer membrane protein n=1 Tax=Nocardiopsis sp. NPDC007018 TaxID=3155721 RepID=UPI0033FB1AD6
MDLPTYTNIWRIEKRLYKLYDFRLPMPLPVGTFGVALGVFALWVVLLSILNAPFAFGNGWHLVLWVVPPGVITVLATRPVIEGKRLTELLISQARFLTEARVFTRLAPEYEPAEIRVTVRVWHRDPEAGPLPLPRGTRLARAEEAVEAQKATAVEEEEVTARSGRRAAPEAAPPLRGVPVRQPEVETVPDDPVEPAPARRVAVTVGASAAPITADDVVAEDHHTPDHHDVADHRALADDAPEGARRGVGRRVLNYFGFGLSHQAREHEPHSVERAPAAPGGDGFDEPLHVTEEDEQRDRDEWFARLRASSGETPLGLTSKSAYAESETGAMSSAELADAAGRREPDRSRRRAEEIMGAHEDQESPAARRLRGRTQGIRVARDLADRREHTAGTDGEPVRERVRETPAARTGRARGAALPDTGEERPQPRRQGRPHATPWALEPERESGTDYPDLSDYAARYAAATGRPSAVGDVSAAPWLPPAAAAPADEKGPVTGKGQEDAGDAEAGRGPRVSPEPEPEPEPIGRTEAGPQVSHATHDLGRPDSEDTTKPPLQLDHGTGEHEAMATEHGTAWNEHMSVLDRHLIKADTPAPPRPKFADAVPDRERDGDRRDPADWFDDGKRRHPDQPKVGDRDNPVIVVSELREERRAAAEARRREAESAEGQRDTGSAEDRAERVEETPGEGSATGDDGAATALPVEAAVGRTAVAEDAPPAAPTEPVADHGDAGSEQDRVTGPTATSGTGAAPSADQVAPEPVRGREDGASDTRERPGPGAEALPEPEQTAAPEVGRPDPVKPPNQLDHGTGELVSFVEVREDPGATELHSTARDSVPPADRPAPEEAAARPTETALAEAEAAALRARRSRTGPEAIGPEPEGTATDTEPRRTDTDAEPRGNASPVPEPEGTATDTDHDPHDGVFHRVAQNARRIGQLFGQPVPGEEPEPPARPEPGDAARPDLELDHGTGEQARLGDTPNPSQRPAPEPVPEAEEPDTGTAGHSGGTRGWRRLAKVVTGGAAPVRSDLPASDIERLRTPLPEPRSLVVLGCTGGAGQTVTALMIGHTLAAHRDDRVVAVDVNPGPNGLSRRVGAQAPETLTALLANADAVDEYERMRAYAGRAGTGLEVVQTLDDPYVQTLDDRDYGQLTGLLGGFYGVTLLDPAATGVARALPVADGLVLVAPASADAERAVSMTFEWLDGNGYANLRAHSTLVVNGVSKRSLQDVDAAERVARGRCRAIVRIPWDDHLGSSYTKIDVGALRPATKRAHGALGGVLVNSLAPAGA